MRLIRFGAGGVRFRFVLDFDSTLLGSCFVMIPMKRFSGFCLSLLRHFCYVFLTLFTLEHGLKR